MKTWKIVYTEQAGADLRSIYEYIAFNLLEPALATKLTKRIMDAIANLDHMPLRCSLYEKEPWRSRGLRVLRIGHYLAFYLPIERYETVVIIRLMYGARDIEEQLKPLDITE